jgi:hypothetical protein
MGEGIDKEAAEVVAGCDPSILARAVQYLYTKETKGSLQIEGETVSGSRAERFVAALRRAEEFNTTNAADLVALQNTIVDPCCAAHGFRDFQNFVSETPTGYRP